MTSEWIYRGKIVNLRLDSYDSKKIEVIHTNGSVVIVALNQDEKILFIRQWRPSIGKITLELPAGTLEKNELPIDCAKRELIEETGYSANVFTPLGGFYSTPGFCDEYLHLFLAKDLYPRLLETLNLDSARQRQIEVKRSERRSPFPEGKGKQKDRLAHVAASPNSKFQVGEGITFHSSKRNEDETIDFTFLSMQEVLELIGQGKIEDAKSIAGIMWLKCL